MTVWTSLDDVRAEPAVVSIGTFDGVHRGHRVVVGQARAEAVSRGISLTVLTFDPHPLTVVRPDRVPPAIATVRHRVELLAQSGADSVLVLPFDEQMAAMSAQEFVHLVLVEALKARAVVVGEDFRFGHRAGVRILCLRARTGPQEQRQGEQCGAERKHAQRDPNRPTEGHPLVSVVGIQGHPP